MLSQYKRGLQTTFSVYFAVLVLAGPAGAQAPGKHPVSGRQIAGVMGMGGADWLVRPERMEEERPDLAIEMLDLKPGMTVADIGAGVGFWSMRMAEKVGPGGKVYATDIQPGMLDRLRKNAAARNLTNIEPVLSTPSDAKLPRGAIDLALMVDVYHEFNEPQKMLHQLRAALKDDGRLILLEYREEDPKVPIRAEHKMSIAVVKKELEAEGFRLEKVLDGLPWQHLFIFRKSLNQ